MKFKDAKEMIADIVEHGKNNNAYILPYENSKEGEIGFLCVYSQKKWRISTKNFKKTASKTEKMIMKHKKLRQYFCRAASCKMHDDFERDLRSYMRYLEWYDELPDKKKNYMRLVEKFSSLTK